MKALDTNIFVRWALDDDPEQLDIALELMNEPFVITHTVLIELGWLLFKYNKLSREDVARIMMILLALPTANVADAANIRWAIERFRTRGDWADLIHQATAGNASAIITFDKRFVRDSFGGAVRVELAGGDTQ